MSDREKLIELMEQAYFCSIEELANHLIANGVVVREKGEWIAGVGSWSTRRCSACNWKIPYSWYVDLDELKFCPNCGADMRKGENG